jgi:hypothetical protein
MYLFLLGLLIGFAERQVINLRMALAAHLEGLMNGTFLIAFHQLPGSTIARRHGKKA